MANPFLYSPLVLAELSPENPGLICCLYLKIHRTLNAYTIYSNVTVVLFVLFIYPTVHLKTATIKAC